MATAETACSTARPASERPAPAAPVTSSTAGTGDCTLETPLVEGAPGSPGHLMPSPLRPGGASELAVLMRLMQADLGAAREDLLAGRTPPPIADRHGRLRCSWPTDPRDRNATFDAAGAAYLGAVRTLDGVGPAGENASPDKRAAYNGVIHACLACHANTCPGPVDAIQAMLIP